MAAVSIMSLMAILIGTNALMESEERLRIIPTVRIGAIGDIVGTVRPCAGRATCLLIAVGSWASKPINACLRSLRYRAPDSVLVSESKGQSSISPGKTKLRTRGGAQRRGVERQSEVDKANLKRIRTRWREANLHRFPRCSFSNRQIGDVPSRPSRL